MLSHATLLRLPLQQACRQRGTEVGLTGSHGPHGGHDLQNGTVLQDVSFRSEVEGCLQKILLSVHGEKDRLNLQCSVADLSRYSESVELRHVDIQHGDLGTELFDQSERAFSIPCFSHNDQVGVFLNGHS